MQLKDTYKSISCVSEGLFRDNGSRFIAKAYPVETEERIKEILSSVRKEYHDARHHCYAYRLGLHGEVYRSSDDGEPSGSAGRPILGQIDSFGLSDVLVVVIRYFGGIKLGIPGLIRAYKTSTSDALSSASVVEKIAGKWYRIGFSYEQLPAVMKTVKDMDLPQRSQDFGTDCNMEVRVRLGMQDDFFEKIEKSVIFINEI
ncbi:MAG: YigZ family protein [Bacteroidales bacterium]|mgnify:CR=1 FL=1|nr:YigZ family protein [Bacteroidales bacterium]